jgi:hypothetical protein
MDELRDEINKLEERLLYDDSEDEIKESLECQLIALKDIYQKKLNEQDKEKQDKLNKFVKHFNTISENKENKRIYSIAKENAANTLFNLIAFPPEKIADCFSTPSDLIVHTNGPIKPPRFTYTWYNDLREMNVIPLEPGIIIPTKRLDNGQIKETQFYVSKFYSDPFFIRRLRDYYKEYNIDFSVQKDKKMNHRWWIKLKAEGLIHFKKIKV